MLAIRLPVVDLASEAIILVFTRKLDVFKSFENDLDAFCWLSKHRFERDSDTHVASLFDLVILVSYFEQSLYDETIVGELTGCLFDCKLCLCNQLVEHSLS
jgi:hypothetical protein